ncbi:esterase/lipase family protein [Streptomyces monticola]|uniref:Esterase/lipase family protein n=1 Tax=Streptomyces monticola TaxID=2666263 RepID=A0ABW2JTE3_9ACTN
MTPLRTVCAGALAVVAALVCGSPPAQAADGRGADPADLSPRVVAEIAASVFDADTPPPGANDWSCKPSAKRPRPVVLVHGATENPRQNFAALSPALKAEGYCVFTVIYGEVKKGDHLKGLGPVPKSAKELAAFVDKVRKATKAAKVDLVGHSQGGGLLPRWYLKYEGGASKVHHLIGIAPTNHGTSIAGIGALAQGLRLMGLASVITGQSTADMVVGSEVNKQLDAGGDTVPGVRYTTVNTINDVVNLPFTNGYLTGKPASQVTNLTVQDFCPFSFVGHIGVVYDPAVEQLVKSALDPKDDRRPRCTPVVLPF